MSKKDKKDKSNNKLNKSNNFDYDCHKDDCKSCKKNNNSSKDLF